MSIDNIQLNGYLCQKMFSKNLLETLQTNENQSNTILSDTTKKTSQNSKISCLGENEGNILFIVNDTQNKFIADNEMKLLSDLLTACKISMVDIALVNYNQHPKITYKELIEQFQSKKMLLFGVTASDLDLPFTIPFFQLQKFQEQLYMISPSLSDFINNVKLKKELWNSLKKIFL